MSRALPRVNLPFMKDYSQPQLFEIAWEVANKVGGIYTVIKTKVPVTVEEYGDNYTLIGPLSKKNSSLEVESCVPECPITKYCLESMRNEGVRVVFGKWLIDGSPSVILFDLESVLHRLNEWKADIWALSSIPSPSHDQEMNDAVLFGYLVAWFIGLYCEQRKDAAIVTQYHEWQSSAGLVLSKKRNIPVATVFTTHATLLGRYLCAGNVDFYNNIKHFDVDAEAGRRGIYHRYCLERAAAHCADVFTTVSHITAYEAEHLLLRKPDGVLPNGLNVVKFSALHEFQNLHAANKKKIHSFVQGHFYGHYDFDLDNTIYMFIAGRFEFRNKGVDMFLESLARLNGKLKQYNSPITVVAFIIMPASTQNYNVDSLKGQAVTNQLREVVGAIAKNVEERIFEASLRGKIVDADQILSEEDVVQLKRHILALKRQTLPPIVTHNMTEGHQDPILMELRRLNLFNYPSDRVKVIFHPEFLSSNNPVLGMDYEDFVRGCHLGVFPSYYEPWGYTPAECTLLGIPSVTTNLSGFGCYIEETVESPSDYGIYIVDRRMKSVEESVNQLTDYLFQFCQKSRRQRINQRNRTERLSDLLDWHRMGEEYQKARLLALTRLAAHMGDNLDFGKVPRGVEESGEKFPRPLSAPPSPKSTHIVSREQETSSSTSLKLGLEKLKLHEQPEIDDVTSTVKLESVI